VTIVYEFDYALRRHADAKLERFDFLGYPDLHESSPDPDVQIQTGYRADYAICLRFS